MGKLVRNGIDYSTPTVDDRLDTTSTNPVQNKVITEALGDKVDSDDLQVLSKTTYDALVSKTAKFYFVYADSQ